MTATAGPTLPIPRLVCPFCLVIPMRYAPSGPSGLRLRCEDGCGVVLVIPRAQLRRVARRLSAANARRIGWPS
jgi:hypothetical protein